MQNRNNSSDPVQSMTNALTVKCTVQSSHAITYINPSNPSTPSTPSIPFSRRVLILTYYWPPSGGAGVQRWLKFAKYLPLSGVEPFIVTVDPQFATYPATDLSLEKEIPGSIRVFRTKATDWFRFYGKDKSKVPAAGFASNKDESLKGKILRFIRGNFFIPDPRRGWNKYAFRMASDLIRKENISYIITTSPPHSTQLIGLRLKNAFPGIKWIADLRDAWTDIYYYDLFYPTFISRVIDRYYERKVLRNADRIISVGNNLANLFISKVSGIEGKFHILPNGYDEEDFAGTEAADPARFTITYVGTLSEAYPLDSFLTALARIEKKGTAFVFRIVGSVPGEIREKISSLISANKTEFINYAPHKEAVRLMKGSSVLLLSIPDTKENKAITPGKVFEYIAACKPVLYLGPTDGDAAYHLKLCGHKGIFSGRDPDEIESYLAGIMETAPQSMNPDPAYSRKNLTLELGKILESF